MDTWANEIDTYEIGYSKFDEIAVCCTRTYTYRKPQTEEMTIQFDTIGLSRNVEHLNTSDLTESPTYKDMMELKIRYEWIDVPEIIYRRMLQFIREHSPL